MVSGGSGWFQVVLAAFRWFQTCSDGSRWFQVVPRFSKYAVWTFMFYKGFLDSVGGESIHVFLLELL